MKTITKILAFFLVLTATNLLAQESDYSKYPGFANFGNLESLQDEEMVTEILIEEKLLRMVSKFTQDDDELSELIAGLKLIKVNTFEVTEQNADELMNRASKIDKELVGNKWDRIVKSKSRGEVANVYIKTQGEDQFVGLTVVTVDKNGEAAFINIVGTINMDALGKLGQKFDIPGLDDIKNSK